MNAWQFVLLIHSLVISNVWLFWIKLLWTLLYRFSGGHLHSFLFSIYQVWSCWPWDVYMFNFNSYGQFSLSGWIKWHFYQQFSPAVIVCVAPHTGQHLVLSRRFLTNVNYSGGCVLVTPGFNLHSPQIILNIFSCVYRLVSSFVKYLVQSFHPFLIRLFAFFSLICQIHLIQICSPSERIPCFISLQCLLMRSF